MPERLRSPSIGLAVIIAIAGCGAESSQRATRYAPPQTLDVHWHERYGGNRGIAIGVTAMRLTERAWVVTASVTNATGRPVVVSRPHFTGTKFGLLVTHTAGPKEVARLFGTTFPNPTLLAERAQPPVPRVLPPGASWSGVLRGRGRVPRNRFVHVLFGRFTIDPPVERLPGRFVIVTRHAVRVGS